MNQVFSDKSATTLITLQIGVNGLKVSCQNYEQHNIVIYSNYCNQHNKGNS